MKVGRHPILALFVEFWVLAEGQVLVIGLRDDFHGALLAKDVAVPDKFVLLSPFPHFVIAEPHLDLLHLARIRSLVAIEILNIALSGFIYLHRQHFVIKFPLVDEAHDPKH